MEQNQRGKSKEHILDSITETLPELYNQQVPKTQPPDPNCTTCSSTDANGTSADGMEGNRSLIITDERTSNINESTRL